MTNRVYAKKYTFDYEASTYNSWRSMRNRCLFDNGGNSKHYKGKGITICDEWVNDFIQFHKDMGERPLNTTLDRINNSGNYEPSNCRWATWREQENNKDSLTKIMFENNSYTIGELVYLLDLTPTETNKIYKRHSKYGCKTYEELFSKENLLTLRTNTRANECNICGRTESIKWRKFGSLCNTCYGRALRWNKRTELDIETFPEWENITWRTYND